jgi:ATP-dependent RNA helicase DDX46/PRP5
MYVGNLVLPSKKWNLEDDSDEEEEGEGKEGEPKVEEIDPLDAFMQV